MVTGSSGTVLNEKNTIFCLVSNCKRITVYIDLRSKPELQNSPIRLCFVIKQGTLPLQLVVPNALQP